MSGLWLRHVKTQSPISRRRPRAGLTHQDSTIGKIADLQQIQGGTQMMPEENLMASLNLREKQKGPYPKSTEIRSSIGG
jgi:hypothetical protein